MYIDPLDSWGLFRAGPELHPNHPSGPHLVMDSTVAVVEFGEFIAIAKPISSGINHYSPNREWARGRLVAMIGPSQLAQVMRLD